MKWTFLILALLLASCTQHVCPDGTTVSDPGDCPVAPAEPRAPTEQSEPVAEPDTVEAPTEPPTPPAAAEYSDELAALLERHEEKYRSMTFLHAPIERVSGAMTTSTKHEYSLLGEKARVETFRPSTYNPETLVDTVFLDYDAETAQGFCLNPRATICAEEGREHNVTFDEYAVKRPLEWLEEIPPSAEIVSELNFEDRTVKEVRYEADGRHYSVYIDSFMGVPLRVGIYADEDLATLVGGVEYHDVSFNQVTEDDVTR